jgi:tetratricopeptide (TPR) repeat protein
MAARERRWRRIGWSIAALIVLGACAARFRWQGSWIDSLAARLPGRAHTLTAEAAYDRGDWSRAADLSFGLIKAGSRDAATLRTYARALARLNRDDKAWAIYNGRLGVDRMLPEDYFLVGAILARADKLDEALAVWKKGATFAPEHPELLDQLSRLAIRLKWLDEANDAASRLARFPNWNSRALLLRGEIQGLLENPEDAIAALHEGLTIDPDANGAALPAIQYRLLVARNLLKLGQTDDAIAVLEKAPTAASPTSSLNPEAEWLLSRAYLRKGRVTDALATLRRAGSYRDENPLMAEPSPYAGSMGCMPCHSKISKEHDRSRHARTFHHGAGLLALPLPARPLVDPVQPKVTHTFERERDRVRIDTLASDQLYKTVVEYAFGASDRAVTMIGRDTEGSYRAARLSYYHSADGGIWDRSLGDVPDTGSVESFRGERVGVRDGVVRCLYCHVTQARNYRNPLPATGRGPEAADQGIGCERCHGPGANHIAAIKASFPDRAIVNAGTASAPAIVAQCADCHIVGVASEIREQPQNPGFVRSPGATFTASRCFTESSGALSCLTCHDPHSDTRQSSAFYESKCLACHAATTTSLKSCRVNPANDCLNCHMPKIPVAVLHDSMTDHYIRVHREK